MARPLPLVVALPVAFLMAVVLLVLGAPLGVSAEATHSGSFSVAENVTEPIYGNAQDNKAGDVLLTLCRSTGSVRLLVNGLFLLQLGTSSTSCFTQRFLEVRVMELFANPGAGTASGTYTLSVNLQPEPKN